MTLPHETEADQSPIEPFVPTQADQDSATAMFAESPDQYPVDYDLWLDSLYGASLLGELDRLAASIVLEEQAQAEFAAAACRCAVNQLTDSELATIAAHGTV
jgi:hypothetical protein